MAGSMPKRQNSFQTLADTALTASIGLVNQHKGNRMNLKYIAALIGSLSVATVSAAGLDAFQQKVDQIAEQHGVAAPDVKKEISGLMEYSCEFIPQDLKRVSSDSPVALRNPE